ncbi:methylated-DNA--[protein]-cysteine S-methyltransferase [Corynebacterium macginleyi]|uniref:methylated-DNA--[protein]-cysteine S-methyltransferase n=1 Tax=Corynebacterium macginleyi TaxID=38290 RepID=UPI002D7F6C50|nr:methylated-DNA--[protein]-cysteine S-methyltransferase [Corynebacterium macginleyi]
MYRDRVDTDTDEMFVLAKVELDEFLAGERKTFDLPVRTPGYEFSERVWAMLREIPYGETTTYGALAERLGNGRLAQRVGQAVGRNPVSIVAPCHRVVGAGGSLTGYEGEPDRKRFLLELEEPAGITGFATVLESQTSRFTRLNWSANLTFWITHDLTR